MRALASDALCCVSLCACSLPVLCSPPPLPSLLCCNARCAAHYCAPRGSAVPCAGRWGGKRTTTTTTTTTTGEPACDRFFFFFFLFSFFLFLFLIFDRIDTGSSSETRKRETGRGTAEDEKSYGEEVRRNEEGKERRR